MLADLFTSSDYLDPLEAHGCVGGRSGWQAAHIEIGNHARAPAYLKTHSWGEFVFDFQIAQAYARHGLAYYPKLVCCVPYTPVPGPRLLADNDHDRARIVTAMIETVHAADASGAHVLYPHAPDAVVLEDSGWLRREQLRYVWENRGYADFDAFLDALSAKRRKNLRRERRLVAEVGFEIRWQSGDGFSDAEQQTLYALYARTYLVRGQAPYLTADCLADWSSRFGERLQFCVARRNDSIVAMAFFFVDGDRLCGRHWGTEADNELLHFELCYYQGIDYAIRHGLARFDAGVQGEHKLLRGFDPISVPSLHWYRHTGFRDALAAHYEEERHQVTQQIGALAAHSAYRA